MESYKGFFSALSAVTKDGESLLHLAAKAGMDEVLKVLLVMTDKK